MVNPTVFREEIENIVSQDYRIEFLGKNFDQTVSLLSDSKAERIYFWIDKVLKEKIQPISLGSKRPYKKWTVSELLTFRYPFTIQNTEYRILFVKVKNSIYIEFQLGDHKYYDKVRQDLNLKKRSY